MTYRALLCLVPVGLVLSGCDLLGFHTRDPMFCCTTTEACARPRGSDTFVECPSGQVCDNEGLFGPSRSCVEDTGECFGPDDCTEPGLPLCIDNTCRACDATTGCEVTAPVCDVGGTYTCGGCGAEPDCAGYPATPHCGSDGACVACRDGADCTDPSALICDTATETCRGCLVDAECESGVCNEEAGTCLGEDQIVYVAPTGAAGTCTQAAPCLTITQGVAAVTEARRTILVAAGDYNEQLDLNDQTFTIFGTGATLSSTTTGELINVLGASTVTIDGLTVENAAGPTGDGVKCSADGGDEPVVTLRRVTIKGSGGRGINASSCTVNLSQSTISGNLGGGISMSGGTASLENNVIFGNGGALTQFGGLKLDNLAALTFAFNTVAANVSSAAFAAGLQCSAVAALALSNSIVVGQAADQISTTNCTVTYSATSEAVTGTGNLTDAPSFVDAGNGDFHLTVTSPGIDAADPAATLAIDIDGDARPQGARRDMGADEVRE